MPKLSPEQQSQVASWVIQGVSLSDVQKRISKEFGVSLTYMDTRMLVSDLDVEIPSKPDPKPVTPPPAPVPAAPAELPSVADFGGPETPAAASKVSVEVDKISVPGAMASGSVTFSDGKKGRWMIDQTGYPRLIPPEPGYRPTQEDMYAIQDELAKALQRLGY